MPEGVGYGPQDTASSGLYLNIIGNHAYGYSGVLDIDNVETDMLLFRTGNFYFVGTIQFNVVERHGESFLYQLYLNETVVQGYIIDPDEARQPPTNFIDIIIAPYTEVKATAQNMISATKYRTLCNMAGRIYGKID